MTEFFFNFKDLTNIQNPNKVMLNLSSFIISDDYVKKLFPKRYNFYMKFVDGFSSPSNLYKYLYRTKEGKNYYNELQNKLNNYETTIFNRKIDYCPIEYYGKDIVYFLKFNIPIHLYSEYTSKYTKLDNKDYSCVEFGVTSNIEERLKSHKRDKKKENLIFLHAIELKKRYTASKMEFYIKTIAQQLNIKFEYEKKKECVLVNEEMFNILVNKIKTGLINLEYDYEENELEEDKEMVKCNYNVEIKKLDNEIEIKKLDNEKEIELKKIEMITELIKNKLITLDEFKNMLGF